MATQPSRLEANRLYWETESSVGDIAENLGLSRRALYELLDPVAADGPCPGCGEPLLFANRLARAAGDAICRGCGTSRHVVLPSRPPEARQEATPASAPTPRSRRAMAAQDAVRREDEEAPIPDVELPDWTSPIGISRRATFPLRAIGVAVLALAGGVAIGVILRRRRG